MPRAHVRKARCRAACLAVDYRGRGTALVQLPLGAALRQAPPEIWQLLYRASSEQAVVLREVVRVRESLDVVVCHRLRAHGALYTLELVHVFRDVVCHAVAAAGGFVYARHIVSPFYHVVSLALTHHHKSL